jgi:hypothetical protein
LEELLLEELLLKELLLKELLLEELAAELLLKELLEKLAAELLATARWSGAPGTDKKPVSAPAAVGLPSNQPSSSRGQGPRRGVVGGVESMSQS